ncbi:MAG: hypothetical protein KH020_03005 [Clostridiales bacterium]|nr:hypothetical protein [Clostridiales bacterium]
MTHKDVVAELKTRIPQYANNIKVWFPNGKNSIRFKQDDGTEYVFTYNDPKDWCFETLSNYTKKKKEKKMKVMVKRAVCNMNDLANTIDYNAVVNELQQMKQAKTNRRLFFIMATVTFVTFLNFCGRVSENEEIEKLKIRLDDVEGEHRM